MISKKRFLLYLNPAVLLMLWISKKKKDHVSQKVKKM